MREVKEQQQTKISHWMHTALSIATLGSPAKSAKYLGISITTIYRHLDALEKAIEFNIFDRSNSGWKLKDEASILLKTSKEIEQLLSHAENEIRHAAGVESGILRIAVSDDFASYVCKHLQDFCQTYPQIQPELIISSQFSDLVHGHADVAIRPDMNPGDNLVGQHIDMMNHALYASEDYIKKRDLPSHSHDLKNHLICGYGFELQNYSAARWESENIPPESIIARFGTTTAMAQAVLEGLGIGILPCFIGDDEPTLSRIIKIKCDLPIDIWLVSTVITRKRPKVKAFFDFFTPIMKADSAKFTGYYDRNL